MVYYTMKFLKIKPPVKRNPKILFGNFLSSEAISKLLKIVKAPSLRSDKGSVFGCYLAGSSLKLPFTALCE